MTVSSRIDRLLLILGSLLMAIYVSACVHSATLSQGELKHFHETEANQPIKTAVRVLPGTQSKLEISLSSEKRLSAYQQSLAYLDPPLALLRVSMAHLEIRVLEGAADLTLNCGVRYIIGTDRPNEGGNIGIAGHPDGFFRALNNVGPGDTIELVMHKQVVTYVVDNIVLVRPHDISVQLPRWRPSLTLVTCYPFDFVGSAAPRYIIQASMIGSEMPIPNISKESSEPGVSPQ